MPIMMINTAVLHIFDFNTNVCIVSQKDLDFSSDVVYEYVSKRLNRIIGDAAQDGRLLCDQRLSDEIAGPR